MVQSREALRRAAALLLSTGHFHGRDYYYLRITAQGEGWVA